MAELRRIVLYFGLAFVLFLLWSAWEKDHAPNKNQPKQVALEANQKNVDDLIPLQKNEKNVMTEIPVSVASVKGVAVPEEQMVRVKTDVMEVLIDKRGGNIVKLNLLKYPDSLKSKQTVDLFNALSVENKHYALGVSGIISKLGPDSQTSKGVYQSDQKEYQLADNEKELAVVLRWRSPEGLFVNKTILFERGKYSVRVSHEVENKTSKPWAGNFYAEIKGKESDAESNSMALSTFVGASISTEKDHYSKVSFKKMNKQNIDEVSKGGWLAFQKRYFVSAWVPEQTQTNHYYTRADIENKIYTIGVVGPELSLNQGEKVKVNSTLYAGPEVAKELKKLAPYLELTVDYGWLWFLAGPIFWVMEQIHAWVGNWGLSIILVTLLIKLAFFHLSATSYRSMAKMQKLTPLLNKIREQYKDDRQKISMETIAIYRKEKVNPLSGCLPMFVQIPFFIALYYVLLESVELRQAPFMLWVQDLSSKDPFYVLPILMGISMFAQQKLSPPPPDPMQAKIMMFMPIMFTVFFLNFPAGLVLYWLTNNCLSILQQWWIMRTVKAEK